MAAIATDTASSDVRPHRHRGLLLALALVLLFYAAAVPVIFLNLGAMSRAASDQDQFHLRVIHQFIEQWPHPDLSDYLSSTTPGYHLTVAGIARQAGQSIVTLRLIGSLFTLGLLATLGLGVGGHQSFLRGLALCLPVLCSIYVFSSGAFLLPDNAGWWGVLAILLLALRRKVDLWTYAGGGIILFVLVWVRQVHVWVAGPLWVAVLLGGAAASPKRAGISITSAGALRLLLMAAATLPAFLMLAWFRHLWHGSLVPPNQISTSSGGNFVAPAVILSLAGVAGVFYAGLLVRFDRAWLGMRSASLIAGLMLGLIVGALPQSMYGYETRHFSGIWNAVKHLPYVMHRSPLLIGCSAFGGMVIAAWLASMPVRQRLIWGTALVAFVAAQMANANPWQRYYEPLILIAAAITIRPREDVPLWRQTAGPLLLSLLLAWVTMKGLR